MVLQVRLSDKTLTEKGVLNFYLSCFEANLNGEYFPVDADNGYYRGIIWELWLGDNSLKAATMMVRSNQRAVM